jgi:hypothetical protein
MMKKAVKYTLWVLGLVVVISALQYIWIGVYRFAPLIYRGRAQAIPDQRPVHLTIRATDQFGKPVVGYRFKAKCALVAWYFHLFPLWAEHHPEYVLRTDDSGIAKLNLCLRKAYDISLEELPNDSYVFAEGKESTFGNVRDSLSGPFMLKGMDGTDQIISMKLLRHDPPVKLTRYSPDIPGRGPIGKGSGGAQIDAQDEMVFTVDVMENKFYEGRQAGDILITVKNAKAACEMFTKIYTPNFNFKEEGEWDVSFEALNGASIQRAESHQIITFAPETGYKKRLNYRMAIKEEMSKAESEESHSSGGELFKLVRSAPDEEDYASIGPQGACGAHLYLRHDNPRWYGFVLIGLGPMYREGRLSINADGAYNPDGSTNLWTGHPYSPAGY